MPRNYARPMFQHRHYEAIAAALLKARNARTDAEARSGIAEAECEMLSMFVVDNPQFNPVRFRRASGGDR